MNGPISRLEFIVLLILIFVGLSPFLKHAPEIGDWYWRTLAMSEVDPGLLMTFHIAIVCGAIAAIFSNR